MSFGGGWIAGRLWTVLLQIFLSGGWGDGSPWDPSVIHDLDDLAFRESVFAWLRACMLTSEAFSRDDQHPHRLLARREDAALRGHGR